MGIWIRSQDREQLKEVKFLEIEEVNRLNINYANIKVGATNSYGINGLGYYSTQEKALKVLDMIEKHICEQNVLFGEMNANSDLGGTISTQRIKVFQMPQDSDVAE